MGEWLSSYACRFNPVEGVPGTHWIGWVNPRAGLDELEKKNSWPYRDSDPLVVQPVATRCTDYVIRTPLYYDQEEIEPNTPALARPMKKFISARAALGTVITKN
jgi:hypothetical protein